jgi:hypothetical protein
MSWCMASGSDPETKWGWYPYPTSRLVSSYRGMRANTVGLAIL